MLREHPYLSMCIEPPRTYTRCNISVLSQPWWSPAVVGWRLGLYSTNVLFKRIYQLLLKLANVPEVPLSQLYWDIINTSKPTHLFTTKDDDECPSFIWTILMHPETYIGNSGKIYAVCIGVFCFKRSWIRPATPRHWPYSQVSLQHAIMDDDVEVASIYRHNIKVDEPWRPPTIMTCILSRRLQGWRVTVSSQLWQKEFL